MHLCYRIAHCKWRTRGQERRSTVGRKLPAAAAAAATARLQRSLHLRPSAANALLRKQCRTCLANTIREHRDVVRIGPLPYHRPRTGSKFQLRLGARNCFAVVAAAAPLLRQKRPGFLRALAFASSYLVTHYSVLSPSWPSRADSSR